MRLTIMASIASILMLGAPALSHGHLGNATEATGGNPVATHRSDEGKAHGRAPGNVPSTGSPEDPGSGPAAVPELLHPDCIPGLTDCDD